MRAPSRRMRQWVSSVLSDGCDLAAMGCDDIPAAGRSLAARLLSGPVQTDGGAVAAWGSTPKIGRCHFHPSNGAAAAAWASVHKVDNPMRKVPKEWTGGQDLGLIDGIK